MDLHEHELRALLAQCKTALLRAHHSLTWAVEHAPEDEEYEIEGPYEDDVIGGGEETERFIRLVARSHQVALDCCSEAIARLEQAGIVGDEEEHGVPYDPNDPASPRFRWAGRVGRLREH
jgi:hypothetical protein